MRSLAIAAIVLNVGCVLDRTGQSATESYRRQLAMQGSRLSNLEHQVDQLDSRVSQLEEATRSRGQQEIMRMQTVDQLRQEVANLRGDLEVLQHDYDQSSKDVEARTEDAAWRLAWLEMRAENLEKSLGVRPPPAPPPPGDATDTGASGAEPTTQPEASEAVPEEPPSSPEELLQLAQGHLAAGRYKAAEAVLERFIKEYPKHDAIPEAKYHRAMAMLKDGDYSGAVLAFQDVIDNHHNSPWAAWSMLGQGDAFALQGQKDNAKLFYEDVVRLWPKSKAARQAKSKLAK